MSAWFQLWKNCICSLWLPDVMSIMGLMWCMMLERCWPPSQAASTRGSSDLVGRASLAARCRSMKICSAPQSTRASTSNTSEWRQVLTGPKRKFHPEETAVSPAHGLSSSGGFCLLNVEDTVKQSDLGYRNKNRTLPPFVFDILQASILSFWSAWVPPWIYPRSPATVKEWDLMLQ